MELGASQSLHSPRLARRASWLPRVRRGQRAESPRGRQDPHQPLRQPQLRRPSVYLKGRNGHGDGIGRRQCTEHYKIRPIQRKIRELLGLTKGQRVPSGTAVELWLGISTDEAIRMKPSRDRWIQNRYPLIEAGMSRKQYIAWWQARYDRPLERSACIGCLYQSRQRWVETKRRWPELFAEAVEIDAKPQRTVGLRQGALPASSTGAPRAGGQPR